MRFLFAALAFSLLAASPGFAQSQTQADPDVADVIFSEAEKKVIRDYFGKKSEEKTQQQKQTKAKAETKDKAKPVGKPGGLPPGLAKRDQLPPGLARQLERGGSLPPGLERRGLPDDLSAQLPATPEGVGRVLVDEGVVLIEEATGKVLDVITDVITGTVSGQ